MTSNHIAMRMKCYGRVQGVFYRASTRDMARQLNVAGWVKNVSDGTVLIHAEGTGDDVKRLIEWCHKGPIMASVTKVETQETEIEGFTAFEVRYD